MLISNFGFSQIIWKYQEVLFSSNKNKLVISFFALLLVGLLASALVAYLHVKSRIEVAIQTEIELKANHVVNELSHWTKDTIEQVNRFALYLESHDLNLTKPYDFSEFLKWHPYTQGLQYLGYVSEHNGHYSVDNWQVPDDFEARNRDWYIAGKAENKAVFGQPYISVDSDKQVWMAITSPIRSKGKFIGLASAHVTFDYMLSVLRSFDMDMAGNAFLIDQQGNVVLAALQNVGSIWSQQARVLFRQNQVEGAISMAASSSHTFYVTDTIANLNNRIVFAIPNALIENKIYQCTFTLLTKFLVIFVLVMFALYLSNRHLLAPLFNHLEFDNVTSLPSKKHFKQQVKQRFLLPENKGRLLIISMEDFSRITASYPVEDVSLLQNRIKERVQKILTDSALIGHFSESRYIAYYQVNDENNNDLLELLMSALSEHYEISDNEMFCNFRVGVSDYPEHGNNIETLIDNAFSALSNVSRQNSNSYSVFTEQINRKFSHTQQIHNAIKKGLSAAEFSMVFQPQINTTTGRLIAVEALVRWYSSELKRNVSPAEFIPIAESNGLIVPLGDSIIQQVFKQLSLWNEQGVNVPLVSINISPQQLLSANFFQSLMDNTQCFGVSPTQIELEITETSVLEEPELSIDLLNKLSEQGFSIAIDDFGTGYSSLEYLNLMPLRKLKIDRTFIIDLDKKAKSALLVKTIIAMASNLNLDVLAEGVESKEECDTLMALGCNKIQGYLYSKPLVAKDLEAFIQAQVTT